MPKHIPIALALTALALPATALAQDDELLAEPPSRRTLDDVEDRDAPGVEGAARERARASADPTERFLSGGLRGITPTAAVGATFNLVDEGDRLPGFSFWLGATYYPMPLRLSPFIALGAELESYQTARPRRVDLVPMARLGTAWMKGSPDAFLNQLMPQLSVYAIGGVRLEDFDQVDAIVAGFGVSSPMMGPGTAFMLLQGVPLPNILEVTVERPLASDDYEILIQLGIGI